MRGRRCSLAAVVAVLLCAAGWGAYHYMFAVPGTSHHGALPALTADERALAGAIKTHIATIAAKEHNIDTYDELEKAARYIERTLTALRLQDRAAGIHRARKDRSATSR